MSSAFNKVSDAVGGATNFLVGGNTTKNTNYVGSSEAEKERLANLEGDVNSNYVDQNNTQNYDQNQFRNVNDQFQQLLAHFLAGGSQNPNPTPEQLAQATDFVDKTFTAPTQNALDQYMGNYESQANARAAALGRNPNADIATQQAIAGEGQRNTINLNAERGSRISQRAQDINDQTYNRGLGTLNAGMSGSNFLNNLTQQAFANKLNLLNARSGLANFYQKERQVGKFGTSSGLFTNVNSIENGLGNVAAGGSDFKKNLSSIGSMFGGG